MTERRASGRHADGRPLPGWDRRLRMWIGRLAEKGETWAPGQWRTHDGRRWRCARCGEVTEGRLDHHGWTVPACELCRPEVEVVLR